MRLLKNRLFRTKDLSFNSLLDMSGKGHYIGVQNIAGLANQVRTMLAVLATGNVPVLVKDEYYLSRIKESHGCDISEIFNNLDISSKRNLPTYSGIALPPPAHSKNKTELFNLLNMWGLINASLLPAYVQELECYSEYFFSLGPRMDFVQEELNQDISDVVIHVRDFARERPFWEFDLGTFPGGSNAHRHIIKIDKWSNNRIGNLACILNSRFPDKFCTFLIVSDSPNGDLVKKILSHLIDRNIRVADYSKHPESISNLRDLFVISNAKHLVLNSLSTFGHLGAVLNRNLISCLSV
jgi:hypothetical protein